MGLLNPIGCAVFKHRKEFSGQRLRNVFQLCGPAEQVPISLGICVCVCVCVCVCMCWYAYVYVCVDACVCIYVHQYIMCVYESVFE